mgnify:CR=1 FL=1|jgi:hypothetical protein
MSIEIVLLDVDFFAAAIQGIFAGVAFAVVSFLFAGNNYASNRFARLTESGSHDS